MKLKAQKRDVLGKKVKELRANGEVPAAIYGPSVEPMNIKVDGKALRELYNKVHFNKFFDLEIEGEDKKMTALIKEVQIHPVEDTFFSVNFYIVDEDKKITVDVPVELINESPAVKQKLGFLVHQLTTISLYCLPKDLPDYLEADISELKTIEDVITVSDIQIPEGTELSSNMDPTSAVCYIGTAQKELAAEEAREADMEDALESGEEGVEGEESEGEEGESTEEGGEEKSE